MALPERRLHVVSLDERAASPRDAYSKSRLVRISSFVHGIARVVGELDEDCLVNQVAPDLESTADMLLEMSGKKQAVLDFGIVPETRPWWNERLAAARNGLEQYIEQDFVQPVSSAYIGVRLGFLA